MPSTSVAKSRMTMLRFTLSDGVRYSFSTVKSVARIWTFLICSACETEERRVGKECRSLCDWSSDVCASDLAHDDVALHLERRGQVLVLDGEVGREDLDLLDLLGVRDGRASCRERV